MFEKSHLKNGQNLAVFLVEKVFDFETAGVGEMGFANEMVCYIF